MRNSALRLMVVLILVLGSFGTAHALTLNTRIHKLIQNHSQSMLVLVYSEGRVLEFNPKQNPSLAQTLIRASQEHLPVTIYTSKDQRWIESAQALLNAELLDEAPKSTRIDSNAPLEKYEPSVLKNTAELSDFLNQIFKSLTKPIKFSVASQCYRRAHNWAWEMHSEFQIKSMKAFLFFTDKFIKEKKFNWWFHVAPFVYVENERSGKKPKELVLDRSYHSEGPLPMNDWTEIFVGNDFRCPEISKFQDYEKAQNTEYCVIRKTPMYVYQPDQMEELDATGGQILEFQQEDLIDMGYQLRKPHF